jgi:hypothetical protein
VKSFFLHNKSSHFSLFICGSDFPMQLIASDMVSKLYNLCVETSKRDDDSVDLCDEDAVAYAR